MSCGVVHDAVRLLLFGLDRHALAVAQQHHARGWELKAATTLARLWHNGGRPEVPPSILARADEVIE
jgi:hypothetical protein